MPNALLVSSPIFSHRSMCWMYSAGFLKRRKMEQMEQLIGHALSRVDGVEKLHDRHEVETKSSMHEWKAEVMTASQAIQAEARATAQIIQDLRSQVTALQTRVAELERTPASGGSRPATLEEIVERRNALRKIKEAGLSAGEARAAGYTCADAKAIGYSLLEAKAAGWSSDELRMVGYIDSKGMSSREFFDRYHVSCGEVKAMGRL